MAARCACIHPCTPSPPPAAVRVGRVRAACPVGTAHTSSRLDLPPNPASHVSQTCPHRTHALTSSCSSKTRPRPGVGSESTHHRATTCYLTLSPSHVSQMCPYSLLPPAHLLLQL